METSRCFLIFYFSILNLSSQKLVKAHILIEYFVHLVWDERITRLVRVCNRIWISWPTANSIVFIILWRWCISLSNLILNKIPLQCAYIPRYSEKVSWNHFTFISISFKWNGNNIMDVFVEITIFMLLHINFHFARLDFACKMNRKTKLNRSSIEIKGENNNNTNDR